MLHLFIGLSCGFNSMGAGAEFSNLDFLKEELRDYEIHIATQLVAGLTRREIARQSGKSIRTIEHHLNNMRRILHVEGGPEFTVSLFLFLVHKGLIDPGLFGLRVKSGSD